MESITVLYDARCGFCSEVRTWMEREPTFIDVRFVPADSDALILRYPELDAARTRRELTVVGDDQLVYRGTKAFLMCLWALRRYRGWAIRLSAPGMRAHADQCFRWVSNNRAWLPALRLFFVRML